MTFLENYDRIRRCVEGKPVEQIPYMLYINFPFIKSVTGITSQEYFSDPRLQMEAQMQAMQQWYAQHFPHLPPFPGAPPPPAPQ